MAYMIARERDQTLTDPVVSARDCYKRGDLVQLLPNDHVFELKERLPPASGGRFVRFFISDKTAAEVDALLKQEYGAQWYVEAPDVRNSIAEPTEKESYHKRRFFVDLDAMGAEENARLFKLGEASYTWAEFELYLRDKQETVPNPVEGRRPGGGPRGGMAQALSLGVVVVLMRSTKRIHRGTFLKLIGLFVGLLLLRRPARAATEVPATVGPGRDYSTLNLAEAGEQRDLVAADEIAVFQCYNFESSADVTSVVFSGWATDSTRNIRIEAVDIHDGKWDTSAYRLVTAGIPLTVEQSYTRVYGLQLQSTAGNAAFVISGTNPNLITIERSILRLNAGGAFGGIYINPFINQSTSYNVANCLFWEMSNSTSAGIRLVTSGAGLATLVAYNNTFHTVAKGLRISKSNWTIRLVNNIFAAVSGGVVVDLDGSETTAYTGDYNSTDEASMGDIADAPDDLVNQTFTFVNAAGGDFHLDPSDTGAIGNGVNLFADASLPVTEDVDGEPRPPSGPFDIGMDQQPSAASAGPRFRIIGPLQ